jgi:hypothetical protein
MQHPKEVGDRTTLAVMAALQEAGFAIYIPFGENTRCDVIIDDGAHLSRVQCKTGRLRQGAVRFSVCSHYRHHRLPRVSQRDYHGEVDYFAVHCPETSGVYLIPISDLPVKSWAALRVEPARNNQARRIRKAADYEICRVAVRATKELRVSSGAPAPSA